MLKLLAVSLLLNVGISQALTVQGFENNFEYKHLTKLNSYPPKQSEVIVIMRNISETYGYRSRNDIFYHEAYDVKKKLLQKVNTFKCPGRCMLKIRSSDFAQGVVWSYFNKSNNNPLGCTYAKACDVNITIDFQKGSQELLAIVHLQKVYNCIKETTCRDDVAENDVRPKPLCSSTRPKRAPFSGDTSCVDVRPVNRSVCDFEKDFCDWSSAPGSTFNFKRVKGPTDMAGKTGPAADRHGSLTGYYINADASNNTDKIATLRSPNFPAGIYCVELYYHIFGVEFDGSLRLMMYSSKTAPQIVFSKTRSSDNKWNLFQGNLNAQALDKENFYFEFKARIGKSYTSDIAIDDISITKGRCSK